MGLLYEVSQNWGNCERRSRALVAFFITFPCERKAAESARVLRVGRLNRLPRVRGILENGDIPVDGRSRRLPL